MAQSKKTATKSTVTVEQKGSPIGRPADQRQTLIGLKLNKIGRQSVLEDTPAVPWHDRQGGSSRSCCGLREDVMKLNDIHDNPGSSKDRMRVGRGIGSGKGKTGGRGVKGQKARSGVAIKGFEGGQMPLHRRLPKRGFWNPFSTDYNEVNIGRIQAAVDAGKLASPVTIESLIASGVVSKARDGVKILGVGELSGEADLRGRGCVEERGRGYRKGRRQHQGAGRQEGKGPGGSLSHSYGSPDKLGRTAYVMARVR